MNNYLEVQGVVYFSEEIENDREKCEEVHDRLTDKIIKLIKEEDCNTMLFTRVISDKERELIPYSIYKHFKGKYYAIIDKSNPISKQELNYLKSNSMVENRDYFLEVQHTESKEYTYVYYIDGIWYHEKSFEDKELTLYKSLYDNKTTYARPLDMFLSPVDKYKYPNVGQRYRFEQV